MARRAVSINEGALAHTRTGGSVLRNQAENLVLALCLLNWDLPFPTMTSDSECVAASEGQKSSLP